MSALLYTVCEQLLSATVNAVYQGVALVVLAMLAMRWLKSPNAATRHAIWFTTLLLVAALVPAHFFAALWMNPDAQDAAQVAPPEPTQPATPQVIALAPMQAAVESADIGPAPEPDSAFVEPGFQHNASTSLDIEDLPQAFPPPAPFASAAPARMAAFSEPSAPLSHAPRWRTGMDLVKCLSARIQTAIRLPRFVSFGLVAAWVLLAGIRGARILARLAEIRRAKLVSEPASLKLQQLFEQLSASLRAPRPVRVRLSALHPTPMALGFLHPVVLLPAEMDGGKEGATDAETEHVLRHELAHIARRDDWGNLVQQAIEAALFFHPAVWWISTRLSLEREVACDDHVLEASGHPRGYAITLANAASRMACRRPLLAPGVSGNRSQLQQRITMILNTHRNRSSRLARCWVGFFATAAATLAALFIVAGPRLVLAQSSIAAPKAPTTPAPPDVAEGTPAALPGTTAVETGPRSKPGEDAVEVATIAPKPNELPEASEPLDPLASPPAPAAPVIVALTPASAAAPMRFGAGMPAMPPGALVATASAGADEELVAGEPKPDKPGRKGRPDPKDMSVEERLERIERILDKLQVRDDGRVFHLRAPGASVSTDISVQPKLAFSQDWAVAQANRAAEQAKRAVEAGERAAEAGRRAADRAKSELDRAQSKDPFKWQKEQADGSGRELEALQKARDSLQAQVHSLEEQIKRLEEQRYRLQKQLDGKTDGEGKGESDDAAKP